jgi:hypothetical protein
MIADRYITSTGVYWNPDEYQHEAWVVNQATGEKRCIGWLRDDGRGSDTEMKRRHWWEKEVWGRFLGLAPNK